MQQKEGPLLLSTSQTKGHSHLSEEVQLGREAASGPVGGAASALWWKPQRLSPSLQLG